MDDMDWYGPQAATFGDRVAAARENAGMTPEVLAKRLGIKLSTLRGWEDDLSEPRANKLSMLAGVLNVSMMWLINGEGDGIDSPAEPIGEELGDILAEMRALRADMLKKAETMGRLEKRLRQLMTETSHA